MTNFKSVFFFLHEVKLMVLIPRHVHKGARVNKIYCSRTGSKLKGKRQMCESQRYSGGIHQQKEVKCRLQV